MTTNDTSRIPTAVIQAFCDTLQTKIKEYRERAGYTSSIHDEITKVKHVVGKKYDKINVGDSGKFMFNNTNGRLYFIKGYGRVDEKKCFGNIIDILNSPDTWWYDGYSICNVGTRTQYGFNGPIEINERLEKNEEDV